MIAENSAAFLDLIVKLLERNDYQAIAVDNPKDARRVLAQQDIATAVLDICLVGDSDERDISGLDVARDFARLVRALRDETKRHL